MEYLILGLFILVVAGSFYKFVLSILEFFGKIHRFFLPKEKVLEIAGKKGEKRTKKQMKKLKNHSKYIYTMNDLMIEPEPGRTSQIDHLLFYSDCVFVIETKNYSGKLQGVMNQKQWTKTSLYSSEPKSIYNPFMQNDVHIARLRSLLGERANDYSFYNIVIFSNKNTKLNIGGESFPLTYHFFNAKKIKKIIKNVKNEKSFRKRNKETVGFIKKNQVRSKNKLLDHVSRAKFVSKKSKKQSLLESS